MDLERLIDDVKTRMSVLISKPKMTEKLLSKPPFRFLHDTITSVTNTTGFGEGLYSAEELDSAAITDRAAKMNYLDKIFTLVGICIESALNVQSAKVVAGLEPENTNTFLLALIDCASDENIDNAAAVQRVLSGERPGDNPPPKRKSSSKAPPPSESKSDGGMLNDRQAKGGNDSDSKVGGGGGGFDSKQGHVDMGDVVVPERGKSRGGTRGGKPASHSNSDIGLTQGYGGLPSVNLDHEIERCDGNEATTQLLLGELITKPKLTEKLLGKPPFRFLHDIVMEVINVTGFASGLYTPEESDSSQVNDKAQKMNFLDKIIKVVGVQLNTLVEAKSIKIVSGQEPQITNNFLQLLAVAAKHVPDSRQAVRTVLEGMGVEVPPAIKAAPVTSEPPARQQQQQQQPYQQQHQQMQRHAPSSEPKDEGGFGGGAERKEYGQTGDDKGGEGEEGDGDSKRSARPTTARRRPPKVNAGAKEVTGKDAPVVTKRTEGIMIDGAADDDDADAVPDETRLADDIKADAKSTSNAEPQSKLVKDIMSRQAASEADRAGPVAETPAEEEAGAGASNSEAASKSSGIRLSQGRLRKTGADKKGTGTVVTATVGAPLAEGDMERLRAAIQVLVQHTGPLGTCMDYIQEDVGMMTQELHKWEEEARKYEAEVEIERKKSQQILQPLLAEQANLEDQIKEQIAKISSKKAAIARNDERIQQILKLVATA